ncbi:MAG: cytochrome c biogenesis protein CcsA [Kangiellaceae bacterium]|nr:cytochrome c biogenesis protein CcsA [Kangiellaceae bacterium]
MNLVVLELFGFMLYSGMLIHAWMRLSKMKALSPRLPSILFASIIVHGYIAYLNIDGGAGQNLGVFNIFAMTTWIAMSIVYWNLIKHQAHALLLISIPIAAISLLEVAIFEGEPPLALLQGTYDIWHILLGICSMSILLLAAMQSLLVLYIDNGLRQHPANIYSWLGPLQSMERYLIQLLSIGFLLMTVSLGLATLSTADAFASQSNHKIILTVLSWCVLGSLLIGHYNRGWRGVFAAKWTLVGVFLLVLGYFGTKLVLEFILAT